MPLSKAQRDWACCDALNSFLFDKVWNEPFSEYRVNIQPTLIKDGSSVGIINLIDGSMALPTSADPYYVWAIPVDIFATGLKLPTAEWVSLDTVVNDYNTLIHMYGISGAMFSKCSTWLMYNRTRQFIFIAAKKDMVKKVVPLNSLDNVYLTVYFDSDVANPIRCYSVFVGNTRQFRDIQHDIDLFLGQVKEECQLSVYQNGVEITDVNSSPELVVGDYLDFIIDENILFAFDVDAVQDNQDPAFLSEKDKTWKQLIHIPKALNPDNKIITHNTCDFIIRRKYGPTHGHYLHRASWNRGVGQVTHNDMSIPLFILDAYRDYLQTQEITIHGVVRIHEKDNVLIRDANFIDLLYCDVHDDQRIIEILCGKGPKEIPWWTAAHLEQSEYVRMMFDTPNTAVVTNMQQYVDALGFYQVVNILCKRILDTTITDAFTGTLIYDLPILYAGMKVTPIVYLNGKPIERDYVSTICDYANNQVEVTLSKSVPTVPGDKLTLLLFVTTDQLSYELEVTPQQHSITVPFDDVIIHRKLQSPTACRGVNVESKDVYQHCDPGTNVFITQKTDKGTLVTFSEEYEGSTFEIQSTQCALFQTHYLGQYTQTGATIAIPVMATIEGTTKQVPLFDYKNVSAFLNGNYLVRDIDYLIHEVKDAEGRLSFTEIIIQTMDYFQEGKEDVLDVLFNVNEIEDNSNGFTIQNRLQDETPVNLYFPNISAVHVDGKLIRDMDYRGIYIQLKDEPPLSGGTFEVQTSVPKLVKEFILDYATNRDLGRIKILNEYFYPLVKQDVPYLVLEGKHRIYSVFLNTFLHDIYTGKLVLQADPDVNRMKQQIAPYLRLKEMDLCFKGLDQRFVDYYPQYVNYEIAPEIALVINKYIRTYMPKNEDPTLEVVYE